jgi:hypothetical protein
LWKGVEGAELNLKGFEANLDGGVAEDAHFFGAFGAIRCLQAVVVTGMAAEFSYSGGE